MPYTFYDASISMANGAILSLRQILTEAQKDPRSNALLDSRLIDDMNPLRWQVHYATYQAQYLVAKSTGREDHTEPADDLDDFDKMHSRIQETLALLDSADKEVVNKCAEEMTTYTARGEAMSVPVKAVTGLVNMPNIYFHVSMVYAILRKEGVPLSKRDWSRGFVREFV